MTQPNEIPTAHVPETNFGNIPHADLAVLRGISCIADEDEQRTMLRYLPALLAAYEREQLNSVIIPGLNKELSAAGLRIRQMKDHEEWLSSELCKIEDALGGKNSASIEFALNAIRDLKAEIGENGDALAASRQRIAELEHAFAQHEVQNRVLKQRIAELEASLNSKRISERQDQAALEKYQERIAELEQSQEVWIADCNKLTARNHELSRRIYDLENKITAAQEVISTQDRTITEKDQRISELGAILDKVGHRSGAPYDVCQPDCPRCAWERLKGGEK